MLVKVALFKKDEIVVYLLDEDQNKYNMKLTIYH